MTQKWEKVEAWERSGKAGVGRFNKVGTGKEVESIRMIQGREGGLLKWGEGRRWGDPPD